MRTVAIVTVTVLAYLYFAHSGPPNVQPKPTGVSVSLPPATSVLWPSGYADAYRISQGLAEQIMHAAIENDIPVSIAYALVAVESSFNPNAISSVGAIGLTQIKPSTARTINPNITRSDLFDPETNLDLGFTYLRRLMDRYGDLDHALVAYNMGPTRYDSVRPRATRFAYLDRITEQSNAMGR